MNTYKAKEYWRESKPLKQDSVACRYLKQRHVNTKIALKSGFREGKFKIQDIKNNANKFAMLDCIIIPIGGVDDIEVIQRIVLKEEEEGIIKEHGEKFFFGKTSGKVFRTVSDNENANEVYFVEGIFDAILVREITGCTTYGVLSASAKVVMNVPKNTDKIFICMDNDRNQSGQKGAVKLKRQFLKEGHDVCIIEVPKIIPNKTGIDWLDIRKTNTLEETRDFFKSAKKDAIIKWEEEANCEGKGQIQPVNVAEDIFDILSSEESEEVDVLIYEDGRFLKRNKDNFFETLGKGEVSNLMFKILQKKSFPEETMKESFVSNVIANLKPMLEKESKLPFIRNHEGDIKDLIFVKNGAIKVYPNKVEVLCSNLKNQFTQHRFPVKYDAKKESKIYVPLVKQIFEEKEEKEEKTKALQEFLGACLFPDCFRHKFLLLYGQGRNGKGVLCAAIKAICGKYTTLSLNDMNISKNKFKAAQLDGSIVNVSSDDDALKANVDILKILSAGEEIVVERKNEHSYKMTNTCKLIIATNKEPNFSDKSNAIWSRVLIIQIKFQVDEYKQNEDYSDIDWWRNQSDELSGVLNWAIEGWQRLKKNKKYTLIPESKELIEDSRNLVNPEREFLLENYEEISDKAKEISISVIYGEYSSWCEAGGYNKKNKTVLGREIRNAFPNVTKSRNAKYFPGGSTKRSHYWMGLVVRTDNDEGLKVSKEAMNIKNEDIKNFASKVSEKNIDKMSFEKNYRALSINGLKVMPLTEEFEPCDENWKKYISKAIPSKISEDWIHSYPHANTGLFFGGESNIIGLSFLLI